MPSVERRRLPSAVLQCGVDGPRLSDPPKFSRPGIMPFNLSEFGQSCDGSTTVCSQKKAGALVSECAGSGWRSVQAGASRSAHAIAVAVPVAPTAESGPRRIGIAGIGWGVAGAVRRGAVRGIAIRGIVRIRWIISAVISAVVRACQRAADNGPGGEAAQRRTPSAPAGISGARRGEGCNNDGCRCSESAQGFSHKRHLRVKSKGRN